MAIYLLWALQVWAPGRWQKLPPRKTGPRGVRGVGMSTQSPAHRLPISTPLLSQEVVFTLPKTETTPLCSPLPESKAPGHTRSVHLVPPVSYFRQYTGGGGAGWVARSWLLEQAGRGGEETQTLRESKAPSQMVQDKGSAQTGLGGEVLAGGERCFQDQPHGLLAFFFFLNCTTFLDQYKPWCGHLAAAECPPTPAISRP